MTDTREEELELTRALDVIQSFIWARIKDEADKESVKLNLGQCYALASVIKEELHPRVKKLLATHTKRAEITNEAVIRKDEQLKTVLEIVELFPVHSPERKAIADWWAKTFPKESKALEQQLGDLDE